MSKNPPKKSQFVLVPKAAPLLRNETVSVKWRSTEKKLHIVMRETAELDVLTWLCYIRKIRAEMARSPFVDLGQDSLSLFIMNNQDVLAHIKFRNLEIVKHSCFLATSHEGQLEHKITIVYDDVSMEPVDESDPWELDENPVDKAWQTEYTGKSGGQIAPDSTEK